MHWRLWKKRNRVLIVGYSPRLANGVTKSTHLLLGNMPYLELHIAVRCWHPRWKWLVSTVYGFVTFAFRLLGTPPRVIQIVIASRGDTVKTLPYLWLGKLRGCKVGLHFRTNRANLLDDLPRFVRRVAVWFWRWVDYYSFFSPRLRDEFASCLDTRIPLATIPNPISGEWFHPDVLPRRQRTRDLVFLGRWSHEKGKDDLLAAMQTLDVDGRVRCDIYSDYLMKRNPENCVFHPWLKEDDVRTVLRESKLLLLPSHFEGYPNVLVQAAACGTPFVATRLSGVLDIAEESRAGLLHDVGDIQGMRQAIARLLTDEALWTECSRNGRRWAESLEISKVARIWNRFYTALGVKLP